jgi:alpha-glucosidase
VPLPWNGARPPFGFGPAGAWLPQPTGWRKLTIAVQDTDPESMLTLYRRAIALRRELVGSGDGLRWNAEPPGVLDFTRPDSGLRCVVNLSDAPHDVAGDVVLASTPLEGDRLGPDASVWLAGRPRRRRGAGVVP